MKKLLFLALAGMMLCSCDTHKKELEAAGLQNDSLRNIVAEKENEISDLVSILNEVQEGFQAINAAQDRISVARQQGEANNREVLRQNMADIQRTLQANRELINNLREQLKKSNLTSAKLKGTLEETIERMTQEMEEKTAEIARLQSELAKKDATIAEQKEEISNLNSNVRELDAQNAQKSQTVSQQDKALHTAYFVFGTKKELKQQKILDGSDVLRGNFAKDYFTKIDIRTTKLINLYSKSAKIMTNHPAGSYSLEKDAKGYYSLRVLDPEKFWGVSKYLVIVVK